MVGCAGVPPAPPGTAWHRPPDAARDAVARARGPPPGFAATPQRPGRSPCPARNSALRQRWRRFATRPPASATAPRRHAAFLGRHGRCGVAAVSGGGWAVRTPGARRGAAIRTPNRGRPESGMEWHRERDKSPVFVPGTGSRICWLSISKNGWIEWRMVVERATWLRTRLSERP